MGRGVQQPSARVIALGRLLLASLFVLAIWIDDSQPTKAPLATYGLLACYLLFAAAATVATWSNWWLDARLAGPAHAFDVALFMMLVLLTEGYTSPFFPFFIFLLLSAAIRWGWRSTALTAILLTLVYTLAGLLVVASDDAFDLQRFVIRTGHLVIVSVLLIWFGVNRWGGPGTVPMADPADPLPSSEAPGEAALAAAMRGAGASAGLFLWRARGDSEFAGVAVRGGTVAHIDHQGGALDKMLAMPPFLYELGRDRALYRDGDRNLVRLAPRALVAAELAKAHGLREGMAIPVVSDACEGMLFLEEVRDLSTDHLDLGERIAGEVAGHFQRRALVKAIEESAEARSRLTLARDLHDSVVQFLAGAAFRLEAMKRANAAGRDVAAELGELKQLMLDEQGELRSFITGLRSGPLVSVKALANDMRALAARLAQQWDVRCEFSGRTADLMIPSRLHLDALQLMREAVANAVRHAEAKLIKVRLAAAASELRLEFINDGAALHRRGEEAETPVSLKERVEQAGGTLDLARGMGVTKVSIALPVEGRNP